MVKYGGLGIFSGFKSHFDDVAGQIIIFHQPRFPYSSTAVSPSLVDAGHGPHVGHALGSISTHWKFKKARLTSLMGASRRLIKTSSV